MCSLMPRSNAIALFVRPPAMAPRTSTSRGVRGSRPSTEVSGKMGESVGRSKPSGGFVSSPMPPESGVVHIETGGDGPHRGGQFLATGFPPQPGGRPTPIGPCRQNWRRIGNKYDREFSILGLKFWVGRFIALDGVHDDDVRIKARVRVRHGIGKAIPGISHDGEAGPLQHRDDSVLDHRRSGDDTHPQRGVSSFATLRLGHQTGVATWLS